jgi:hypothetical protein
MNHRTFYETVTRSVSEALNRVETLRAQLNETAAKRESGRYTSSYIRAHIEPELIRLRREIRRTLAEAKAEANDIIADYAAALRQEDELKSEALNDDVKLLNCGVRLNRDELEALLARNTGNPTMTRIILRYAEENHVNMDGVRYVGNQRRIQNLDEVSEVVNIALKWWEYPERRMFQRMLGEGSPFHRVYGQEEPGVAADAAQP